MKYLMNILICFLLLNLTGRMNYADNDYISWSSRYYNSEYDLNQVNSLKLDRYNNIYYTGYSSNLLPEENLLLAKYDQYGNQVWVDFYKGPSQLYCVGQDIAIDHSKNIYVVGYQNNTINGCNMWLRKYDQHGNIVWTKKSENRYPEKAMAVCTDDDKHFYVGGYVTVPGEYENIWVRKYNNKGDEIWTKTFNSEGPDRANKICIDKDNNIYLAGYIYIQGEYKNIWIRKYNDKGKVLWTKTINGTGDEDDYCMDLTLDAKGNVLLLGMLTDSEHDRYYILNKYHVNGTEIWSKKMKKNPKIQYYNCNKILSDDKNIYINGFASYKKGKTYDFIQKFDNNGIGISIKKEVVNNSNSFKETIALDSSYNIIKVGLDILNNNKHIIWLKKISCELQILSQKIEPIQVNKYFKTKLEASGGSGPYKWSIVSGNLPDGLILSDDGIISGTALKEEKIDVTFRVTELNDGYYEKNITLECVKMYSLLK